MSATGLDVFDKMLQTTNTWLKEIMQTVARIGAELIACCAQCCMRCETGSP
jgi:hypothetical protein